MSQEPLIFIPARMASTRLPGKPLAMIGDAPMIVQVWRRAIAANCGRVVVACDDTRIQAAIEQAGGEAVLTNADLPSGSDRIHAALQQVNPRGDCPYIINVQGDMPLLDPAIINEALACLTASGSDIATLACPITEAAERDNPAVVKAVIAAPATTDIPANALYFSRLPVPANAPIHYHHIGIYAYRRAALERFVSLPPSPLEQAEKLEQLRALEAGMRISISIIRTVPLGVDTPEQLETARAAYSANALR